MAREMRFGIQTGPQHVTWPELLDVWQLAEGFVYAERTSYSWDATLFFGGK